MQPSSLRTFGKVAEAFPSSARIGKLALWTLATLGIALIAIVLGGIAALYPPSFSAQLVMLTSAGVIFLAALLIPSEASPPFHWLRRLLYALVLVAAIWPSYLSYHDLPGPDVNPTRLLYWSLVALWFFWLVASSELRSLLVSRIGHFKPFVILLIAYLSWLIVASLFSEEIYYSLHYSIKLMIGPVLLFLIALSILRDRRDVDTVFLLLVVGALIACLVGFWEAAKKGNVFYDIVPSLFPQGTAAADFWAEKLAGDKSRAGAYRVMATFSHPLTFGEHLVLCLPLAVYLVGYARQRLIRLVGLVSTPALLVGIYLSHTRSTLLAGGVVMASVVAFLGMRAMRQRKSFGISVAGAFSLVTLVLGLLLMTGLVTELVVGRNAAEAGSSMARLTMLERGSTLVMTSPVVGYGPALGAYKLGFLPGMSTLTIDNYYLSVAMETGLLGLLLFLGLLAYPITKGFFASIAMSGGDGARISVIVAALLAFSVVKVALSLTENLEIVFLLIALLALSTQVDNKARPTQTPNA